MPPFGPRRRQQPKPQPAPEKKPPMPSTGCDKCSYRWVNGKWVLVWSWDCSVHPNPSDLT